MNGFDRNLNSAIRFTENKFTSLQRCLRFKGTQSKELCMTTFDTWHMWCQKGNSYRQREIIRVWPAQSVCWARWNEVSEMLWFFFSCEKTVIRTKMSPTGTPYVYAQTLRTYQQSCTQSFPHYDDPWSCEQTREIFFLFISEVSMLLIIRRY